MSSRGTWLVLTMVENFTYKALFVYLSAIVFGYVLFLNADNRMIAAQVAIFCGFFISFVSGNIDYLSKYKELIRLAVVFFFIGSFLGLI